MLSHAPTPYELKGKSVNGKNQFNIIGTRLGTRYKICTVPFLYPGDDEKQAEEIAEFIVKACNNHERLKDTIDSLMKALGKYPIPSLVSEDVEAYQNAHNILTELKS